MIGEQYKPAPMEKLLVEIIEQSGLSS